MVLSANPLRATWCLNVPSLVVMMHECNPGELFASSAFKHHADPTELIHSRRVGMMRECSHGELPTRATFMHHTDKGRSRSKALCGPWRVTKSEGRLWVGRQTVRDEGGWSEAAAVTQKRASLEPGRAGK